MNCKIQGGGSGKYSNKGTSFGAASYLEHEDMERMKQGLEAEPFFNHDQTNVSKKELVKDIDGNKAKLCKDDAKFYVMTISPSQSEVRAMGKTPQEQSENFKTYIREDVMQKYAESFSKGLNNDNIKYYAKIHHARGENGDAQMHCHILVSRKDMDNRLKISPQTNHNGEKKTGTVKGGFNKIDFYNKVEGSFDKRFDYKRSKEESFKYCNTMKNGSIKDIEKMAEKNAQESKTNKIDNVRSQKQQKDIEQQKLINKPIKNKNKSKGRGLSL